MGVAVSVGVASIEGVVSIGLGLGLLEGDEGVASAGEGLDVESGEGVSTGEGVVVGQLVN